jgi:peptidyl-prolyl cis-trans isomerase A (cyclophilin A)
MRCSGLLTLVLLGCAAKPAPPPTTPTTPATASEARLGRAAEAVPAQAEPDPEPDPASTGVLASMPPLPELATFEAPPIYRVRVTTTEGEFIVIVDRSLAPNAANRFYNLVQLGYYRNATFFRAIAGFMVQFGLHGDPEVNRAWEFATIPDDPVLTSNTRGTVAFAKTARPDSANTQLFINLADNTQLDGMGFAPFGSVVSGMDVVFQIHTGYGEGAPRGQGPSQSEIQARGEAYLAEFPELTRIVDMSLM